MFTSVLLYFLVVKFPDKEALSSKLISGAIRRHCHPTPSFFALAFNNELNDRGRFKKLHGNNLSTSRTNLVRFHLVTSEITKRSSKSGTAKYRQR